MPASPPYAAPSRRALLRTPASSLAEACALTFIERQPIAMPRILAEHAAYAEVLRRRGLQVTVLPALPAFPDSVFVEDNLVAVDEAVVLTRPGSASRLGEIEAIAAAAADWAQPRPLLRLQAPATLDGGDVLRIGSRLWVGLTTRSNLDAVLQLRTLLQPFGYRVDAVSVPGSLHLKTACTALDEETLLVNPRWIDPAALGRFRLIEVDAGEAFAANVVRCQGWLLANAAFPRTLEKIALHASRQGIAVETVELSEFGKAEAGLSCLSSLL